MHVGEKNCDCTGKSRKIQEKQYCFQLGNEYDYEFFYITLLLYIDNHALFAGKKGLFMS